MKKTIISKNNCDKKVLQFFSSLADETRLKILLSMANGRKSVGEIYSFVGKDKMTLSAISHQLKSLSDSGIVSYTKIGKEKYFELSENHCWCILRDAFKQFNGKIQITCRKCGK
ncbi:MAG: metalloregulator ArsR/SmtB family transcription factor [Nanoarchaeota archaeon]